MLSSCSNKNLERLFSVILSKKNTKGLKKKKKFAQSDCIIL